MTYQAPVKDMLFVLNHLAGLPQVAALPGFEEATPDTTCWKNPPVMPATCWRR
jgi:hypothetical protein